jgi:aminoglycoside phosphotransferase family enzyme
MSELRSLIRALLNPETYSHSPEKVRLVQTQMSLLFLTGNYVYKVKKPVDLGYLDYSTLVKRRFFCQQELKLNQRLCPDVYLEVVPLVEQGGRIVLGGNGKVVEYAVKMRQLPAERMMDILLSRNQVSEEMAQRVGEKVAVFHQQAETSADISRYGSLNAVLTNTEENFVQTAKYIGVSISERQYEAIKTFTNTFVEQNARLFEKRVRDQRIRDCHGDLHSSHVCFVNSICIYDCIEFNDRFRYCDVASEVAFLAMDLDYHGRPDLSKHFANSYINVRQDEELLKLLAFYKCYRAYVRGKVGCFKLDDPLIPEEEKARDLTAARKYFELAESYIMA